VAAGAPSGDLQQLVRLQRHAPLRVLPAVVDDEAGVVGEVGAVLRLQEEVPERQVR